MINRTALAMFVFAGAGLLAATGHSASALDTQCQSKGGAYIQSGSVPACAVFTVTVFDKKNGDCATVGCKALVRLNWDFTSPSCSDTYGWAYNDCALEEDSGADTRALEILACGSDSSVDVNMGIVNPSFNKEDCTGGPPLTTVVASYKLWRECTPCDN